MKRGIKLRSDLAIFAALTFVGSAAISFARPVQILVTVSADTPAEASIYLAGSLPSIGDWKADGLRLTKQGERSYAAELLVDSGTAFEFKITRGTWDTVEKLADGSERPNRSVTVDANTKTIDVTVERWAAGAEKVASTVVGTLQLHTIDSKSLGKPRTIRVWLPPGYEDDPQARYDVIYMQDGQNLFDHVTASFGHEWQIDETLTRLINEKKIRPIIVVGIDNGGFDRIKELTYAADEKQRGGAAATYASFLLDEVKPFVEKTYRVESGATHTCIGGSSLGGLFSLDVARRNPDVFGGVLAMSPSLWWRGDPITPAVIQDPGGLAKAHVWLDMGTAEGDEGALKSASYVDDAKRMDAALTKHGITHRLTLDDGAQHNEEAWARRFPEAIQYLLARE